MAEIAFVRAVAGLLLVMAIVAGCGDPAPSDSPDPSQDGLQSQPFQCLGVSPRKCNDLLQNVQAGGVVAAIRIVCTKPPCTDQQGEVRVDVIYANGQRTSEGAGWGTVGGAVQVPAPVPVPAVASPAPS